MEIGKTVISSLFFFLERPTARLVGPESMIHSPNCFALPCAVPFHKINAGYETTVNSSSLRYGYYFDAILLNQHVIKAQRALPYACTHACSCVYAKILCGTSAKIIQWRCRDGMHHAKNRGNKVIPGPSAILSRILAQSCITPPYIILRQRGWLSMIVLVSLIVLLRELPCFHDFSHGASHPYISIHSIE